MRGYAHAGIRQFENAYDALDRAAISATQHNDPFAEQNAYALRVRVLLQEGRAAEACALEPPDVAFAVKGMRGEVMASRALALATIGRLVEARELGEAARSATQAIETRILCLAITAVEALKSRHSSLMELAAELVQTAFNSGAVDLLVCSYRANPDLLATLLTTPACVEQTVFALGRAGDREFAESLGLSMAGRLDPRVSLSTREREVYDLVCAGLSNREIAVKLFITESTVKVHVHHVFDKLGIRSRTALALNAVQERRRQANPTADADNSGSSDG
jgi:DNA-binding NarL/FixJ family response regulator